MYVTGICLSKRVSTLNKSFRFIRKLNLTLNPIQEQPTLYDFSMALRFVITVLMTPTQINKGNRAMLDIKHFFYVHNSKIS